MDTERIALCGDGAPTERGELLFDRHPYLQNLDAQGASVLMTIPSDTVPPEALSLEVTTPDGASAGTVSLGVDEVGAPEGVTPLRGRVDGLSPFSIYCYQLFEDGQALTELGGFRTAPTAGDTATKFGFVVLGDSGGATADQRKVLEQMQSVDHDFMVHVGDIAYVDGTYAQFDQHHFDVYRSLFRLVPHFPVPGNHDYKTERGAPYLSVFELPRNGDPLDPERYYSYDYGPIHFIALDTNNFTDAQEQWMIEDLEATDQPFIIAYGHHPPYSSGDHGSDATIRSRVTPELARHGAQLMLTGHDHHYERSNSIDGVTYVVSGGGGIGTRPTGASNFTAIAGEVLQFVYMEYDGEDLIFHAIDATGREFDNLVLPPRGAVKVPVDEAA